MTYERRQTGDADMSRYYRYVWHINGVAASPYQTRLLDELAVDDLVLGTFGIGPQTVAVWLR